MIFNRFRLKVIVRLFLIAISMGLFLYLIFIANQYIRSIYLLAITCLGLVELFWFIDRVNRDTANFFEAIIQSDFTTTFAEKRNTGKSFDQLYQSMNRITKKFQDIGEDRELQYQLLETILEQVSVGIVSFNSEDKVGVANNAFKNLLGLSYLREIKSIRKVSPDLFKVLKEIKPNKSSQLKIEKEGKLLYLSILASLIKVHGQEVKLVTIQNIKNEIEAGEVEAWQKLIRVLAHEIMNSVTPITSLTDTLLEILENEKTKKHENQYSNNFSKGLNAIKNRSEALNRFTKAYQSISRIPEPKFSSISSQEFCDSIKTLFASEMNKNNITFETISIPSYLDFIGDKDLLGQVIVNLIKNALDAILQYPSKGQSIISLKIEKEGDDIKIVVEDNGPGIQEDQLDSIFIPFFTTRKKGSGIGLTVVKQIVQLHKGSVEVKSIPGKLTSFIIRI